MMGKVFSVLRRPFINFAVEERAHKVMEKAAKTKPTKAPLYPTEERVLKQIQYEHPELVEKIRAKNDKLNDFLKQVKVNSELLPAEQNPSVIAAGHSTKNLPKERLPHALSEYGLPEIPNEKVPRGKLSFRQSMEILQKISHKEDAHHSANFTDAKSLAVDKYHVKADDAELIFKYFQPFLFSKDVDDLLVTRQSPEETKDPVISTSEMLQDTAKYILQGRADKQKFKVKQAAQFQKLRNESTAKLAENPSVGEQNTKDDKNG